MEQVIYVDVLIFFNTVITFILFLSTSQFIDCPVKASRIILGSLVGGAYSMIILAPPLNPLVVILLRIFMAVTLVCIVFNPRKIKLFFRASLIFLLSGFLYAGLMYGIFYLLQPSFLQINNGFAYYNVSVPSMLVISIGVYTAIVILKKTVFKKTAKDMIYRVDMFYGDNSITEYALLDTGNELRDVFNQKPVIILNREAVFRLTGKLIGIETVAEESTMLLRLLPINTVAGSKLLPVFVTDRITVHKDSGSKEYINAEIAVTEDDLGGEKYRALLSCDFI